MLRSFTSAVCLFLAGSATADDAIRLAYTGTAHDALYAIDVDGSQMVAAGVGVGLLESQDGGRSWIEGDAITRDSAVLGLAIAGDQTLAVGQQGKAWRRDREGTWQAMEIGPNERWLNVGLNAKGLAVAVGGFGALAVSNDAGVTWTAKELPWSDYLDGWFEPHLYDVSVDRSAITVVGEFGLVLRSEDNGAHWEVVSKGDESLFAVDLRPDGRGYVVGQDGYIATTRDHGKSWSPCAYRGDTNLFGVSSQDNSTLVVGIRTVLSSTDLCRSFTRHGTDTTTAGWWQAAVYSAEQNAFIAIGSEGRVLSINNF